MATDNAKPVGLRGATIVAMVFDVFGAVLLAFYGLLLGPLGVLRGPIVIERAVWYIWVLLPQGLMARSIRAAIDWRLGHFDSAIGQLEGLVGSTEEYYRDRPGSRIRRRVLEDFYTLLARTYLHAGHIDDAMLVIIRAKKSMAIDRLPGLAELDAKTAHLVRAGLAAGRLLDGGGLATMFVKSNQPAVPSPAQKPAPLPAGTATKTRSGGQRAPGKGVAGVRQGASSGKAADEAVASKDGEAKIIPFPGRGRLSP